LRVALIQLDPTVGSCEANADRIVAHLRHAEAAGADLAVFPEQAILGYPARDLLLRREAIDRNVRALERIREATRNCRTAAIVGFAEPNETLLGRPAYNSAALLEGGATRAVIRKRLLPTYDVFDEARYFEPAGPQPVVEFRGRRLAISICEDLLAQKLCGRDIYYNADPTADAVAAGAELMINISASPFHYGKLAWRTQTLACAATRGGVPLLYCNQVGGNDELLFDGSSLAIDADGRVVGRAKFCAEDTLLVDLRQLDATPRHAAPEGMAELHAALVMGVRDYARKCGFGSAVLGLSGGIDSALVACLAVDALGQENVHGVALPSRYSSDHSIADARALAENLGIRLSIVPIEPMHAAFETALAASFAGRGADVTEENIQARVRGTTLMALSNKFGGLLLTTGNKSELAVGYCTLYGDMCGGLAVISDVPKTMVYALARHINAISPRPPIPQRSLSKPPSAELRPNQTDQDSLPPYDVLDDILERYEEHAQSAAEIAAAGHDAALVRRVLKLLYTSEYKRRQAAPGLKVTSKAFGSGRRVPIAMRADV
jgi:NAD+ synthase (glutamine-hydrolysing)